MMSKLIARNVALISTISAAAWFVAVSTPNAGAQASSARLQPMLAMLPGNGSYSCSVEISYAAQGNTIETYHKEFVVAVGAPFVDDFSTATKEHVFTATAVPQGTGSTIEISYFSDTTALSSVDFSTVLSLGNNQMFETASGRQRSYHSLSGTTELTHVIVCERN